MDVISFFHAIILDTLQSLQSEFQAGDGEAKAFRPTKNSIILCMHVFSFSVKSLIITTLGLQEQDTILCTKTTRIKNQKTLKCRGIGMATQIIKK